ncbi:MAG TPA: FAD-dependent oxidoreductase [Alphaproteobacteria bacterium]|nr:FAD-dependent oxidoreductase [Alphaproteobacteria bacterium]
MEHFDFAVIGGGAAGISVAYELSKAANVALIEQEAAWGYHSTSRSAAVISENYGPLGWQALVSASRRFFEAPPPGFSEHPLLHPIGALYFATREEEPELRESAKELTKRRVEHRLLPAADAGALCPVVKTGEFSLALFEPGCADIDANALLQGYLKLAKVNGTKAFLSAEAISLERRHSSWRLAVGDVELSAGSVVNAAGAWADDLAARAGVQPKGLQPYRRTAITFDPPPGSNVRAWPMTFDVAETWYFKPESGRVMVSPVDKTPAAPCDAAPEELDIAIAVDRIERATTMKVDRIHSKWAGLRTFAPDEQPVIGPDPDEPSFVWLAGQGGNGVMGAPAAAEVAAALATGSNVPDRIADCGVKLEAISPVRFAKANSSSRGDR